MWSGIAVLSQTFRTLRTEEKHHLDTNLWGAYIISLMLWRPHMNSSAFTSRIDEKRMHNSAPRRDDDDNG